MTQQEQSALAMLRGGASFKEAQDKTDLSLEALKTLWAEHGPARRTETGQGAGRAP